jgi:hypothetical protein
MTAPALRWVAGPNRIAHAIPGHGRVSRTACGLPATPDRQTWPPASRCAECLRALGVLA